MYPIYKIKLHNPTMHKLRSELAPSGGEPVRSDTRATTKRKENDKRDVNLNRTE